MERTGTHAEQEDGRLTNGRARNGEELMMERVRGNWTVSALLMHGMLGLALTLCGWAAGASLAADRSAGAPMAPAPGALWIERRGDELSVRAYGAPWAEVLPALARQTGVSIIARGALPETLTQSIEALPLEQGLRRLFREVNTVFFYASGPHGGAAAAPLTEVWLVPRDRSTVATPLPSPGGSTATVLLAAPDSQREGAARSSRPEAPSPAGEVEEDEEEEARTERR
jgi:hypothetical protein